MYGRHGEAPLPIVAARTPSHCFEAAIEAVRLAVTYRTPVILLSDGYLANGAEPWRLPDLSALPAIEPGFASEPNHIDGGRDAELPARTCGTPRPSPGPGRPPGSPGSSTASAGWRRQT